MCFPFRNLMDMSFIKVEPEDSFTENEKNNGTINIPGSKEKVLENSGEFNTVKGTVGYCIVMVYSAILTDGIMSRQGIVKVLYFKKVDVKSRGTRIQYACMFQRLENKYHSVTFYFHSLRRC